jgi:hypothetical protein
LDKARDVKQASQSLLFEGPPSATDGRIDTSSTFVGNMSLPVHRWFRFSAGFSAAWAESVIDAARLTGETRVLDPFCGSGTTLIAAENIGVESVGIEAHPFLSRIARAKLLRRTDAGDFLNLACRVRELADTLKASINHYPQLIRKCYPAEALQRLDRLRRALVQLRDESDAWTLVWLSLAAILRPCSPVGTAQWQYVLPKKEKKRVVDPFDGFDSMVRLMARDMRTCEHVNGPPASLIQGDARTCTDVSDSFATLVVTSPPYPNNYDYADATRLEMCFFGEVAGWGDLQGKVRSGLVRSCSQHVPEKAVNLRFVLAADELLPIRDEITEICEQLAKVRLMKGGKKTYHLMIACYFYDLAQVWRSLRRVCSSPSRLCFVIGDSAPYGVYVPVIEWLGKLAIAAGFHGFRFEKTRDRNVKWKNRKHRVPLCEGRLWVDG